MSRPSIDIDTTTTDQTPLLAGTPTPTTAPSSPSTRSPSPDPTTPTNASSDPLLTGHNATTTTTATNTALRAALRPRVILLALILVFLLELSIGMSIPPMNAVMESIICRQTHPDFFPPALTPAPFPSDQATVTLPGGIDGGGRRGELVLTDDPRCKGPDVQGYLAMLRGWQATFDCVPGIVGAVPFGVLSDRWGRRPVLGVSLGGIVGSMVFIYGVFYFSDVVPLWVTWFGSAFQLIGGGGATVVAMVYTVIADVVPSEERSTVFFQLNAIFLASQMVAGPLGGAMLAWGPWTPLLISLAVLIIANLSIFIFPETVHVHDRKEADDELEMDGDGIPKATQLKQKAYAGLAEVWSFVIGNKRLAFLMLSLVFVILGRFVGELLLQYATDRYRWSWSLASMVLSIRNAGSLVTLLALLPAASWFCGQRLGMEGVEKDLLLARWSGVVQIVGSLIIAAAANGWLFSIGLVWFALGSGMTALIRSLLNSLVEEHHVGTLNSLAGFMEMVGMTMAGPLLAESLNIGLKLGGAWIGLPFVTAGAFFVISTTMLWVFRIPKLSSGRQSPAEA